MIYEEKTMVLYRKLWNFDLQRKYYGTIPKPYETLIYSPKNMVCTLYYTETTLTIELRFIDEKNYGTMEKLWYDGKQTMLLKLLNFDSLWKNYGTCF